MAVISAAISDAALAACALGSAAWLLRGGDRARELGALGLAMTGVAAAFGSARFAGLDLLEPVHEALTALAAMIGVPLLGVAYGVTALERGRATTVAWVALVALATAAFALGGLPAWRLVPGSLALAGVVAIAGRARVWPGVAGALGVALAGLVVGAEGAWGPVLRVDVFHGLLAVSDVALAVGLSRVADAAAAEAPRAVVRPAGAAPRAASRGKRGRKKR